MTNILHPPVEGAAFDAFVASSAPKSRDHQPWTPEYGPMPALYLSHGAPPVFNDALWMDQLFAWSLSLPKPTAILIVSAHWEAAPLMVPAPRCGARDEGVEGGTLDGRVQNIGHGVRSPRSLVDISTIPLSGC